MFTLGDKLRKERARLQLQFGQFVHPLRFQVGYVYEISGGMRG